MNRVQKALTKLAKSRYKACRLAAILVAVPFCLVWGVCAALKEVADEVPDFSRDIARIYKGEF